MGMFDWIVPDLDLVPIPTELKEKIIAGGEKWQSKSFDKLLDTYYLSSKISVEKNQDYNDPIRIDNIKFNGVCVFYIPIGSIKEGNIDFINVKFIYNEGELIHMEWMRNENK